MKGPGAWRPRRGLPPLTGHPVLQPTRNRGVLEETGVQPGSLGARNPPYGGRGWGSQPHSPLKAESFSGRSSSSLYFWSQRNSYRGERAELSKGAAGRTGPQEAQCPGLLSRQVRRARASPAPAEEVGSEAGRGLDGLLQKMEHLQPPGIIGAGTCLPQCTLLWGPGSNEPEDKPPVPQ